MGFRITTWNVNGIRNPFGYQPWREKKTFQGMFDVLEADIVVFQETKIQRKDLRDDMVLVPGWDCYWSLPKHKKGYSGVVIYTRNATCAPIRAEEGITGVLTPPGISTSFRDLPDQEQIGGYPTAAQLSESAVDPATLDSEGRCVILEFPAFVLIGTYCPTERDHTRTDFRIGFVRVLDSRIRNLVGLGKRVIWTGDLNITREEIDTAMAEEMMRKNNVDAVEWISTPARRIFNQLLVGGKVYGERDPEREQPVMWDICRGFHEGRKGMYTCWETKVNARPGNYGARIDYVLCNADMRDWFGDANIQEGLLGSDHCPVYAEIKDRVMVKGVETHILDLMNPHGTFENGSRHQEWTTKNLLPTSGKLIAEFDRRRNIKDMFVRRASSRGGDLETERQDGPTLKDEMATNTVSASTAKTTSGKRMAKSDDAVPSPAAKKAKPAETNNHGSGLPVKGQQSLRGFFKTKAAVAADRESAESQTGSDREKETQESEDRGGENIKDSKNSEELDDLLLDDLVAIDAAEAASKQKQTQTWGRLFRRPIAPKCEHDEPCKTMLTKKAGVNCGRSFWMCNRPLGPSGRKERGTQWRCSTFIWTSDWDGRDGGDGSGAQPG